MSNYLAVGINITDIEDIVYIMERQVKLYTKIDTLDKNNNYYLERLAEAYELNPRHNIIQYLLNDYIGQTVSQVLERLPFCLDIQINIRKYMKLNTNFKVSTEVNYSGELINPNLPLRREMEYPYDILRETEAVNSLFIGIKVELEDRSPATRYNSTNFYLNTEEIRFYTNIVRLLLQSLDIKPDKYIDKILIRSVNK